ncbi:hypothetical protein EsH8_I_001291 [Colletotrichum jinshuiense]
MSSKKSLAKQFQSMESSNGKKGRRGRLFALFGQGQESEDSPRRQVTVSREEMVRTTSPVSSCEGNYQPQNSPQNFQKEEGEKLSQLSDSAYVAKPSLNTIGEKEILKPDVSFRTTAADVINSTEELDIYSMTDVPDKELAYENIRNEAMTVQSITGNATRLPVRRHKKAGSSFKIIDQESAESVLLPVSTYSISPQKSENSFQDKNNAVEIPEAQPGRYTKSTTVEQKPANETHILPSTSYTASANKISNTNKVLDEETIQLSTISYAVPNTMNNIIEASSFDKAPADKKLCFAVTPSTKSEDSDDEDSDDSDKTIKAGAGGMRASAVPYLSPGIWDKGSEPKIWLKGGKPTLFQPIKEPGYYTNPLWSRQYPEILSNDPNMNQYATGYASSVASTNGSQYSESPAANSNLSFNLSPKTPEKIFENTPRARANSPPHTGQSFTAQSFPVIPPTPPGFDYPPRYRNQVKLEVGGRRFNTSIDILERSPYFKHLFSIPFRDWYRDGILHIDNDGDLFAHILRHLRTGLYPLFWDSRNGFDYHMYAMILQQARHYMLPKLEEWIEKQKYYEAVDIQVVHRKVVVANNRDWMSSRSLKGNDLYAISGAVSHGGMGLSVRNDSQSQRENGDSPELEVEVMDSGELEASEVGSDAVALFTTEKTIKVYMDQLRCA